MKTKITKKTDFPDLEQLPPHNHLKHFFNCLFYKFLSLINLLACSSNNDLAFLEISVFKNWAKIDSELNNVDTLIFCMSPIKFKKNGEKLYHN